MIRTYRGFYSLILILAGAAGARAQQDPPTQIASLRPDQHLLWQRVSPTAQKPDGPVLYQIIFRSSAAPNHIPKISDRHTLVDSLLTDDGSQVAIGNLTIASSGVISFANGQAFPGAVSGISAGDGSIAIGGSGSAPTVSVATNGITNANLADGSVAPAKITGTAATLGANSFTGDQRVGSNIQLKAVNGSLFALSGSFGGNASGPALSANQFGQDRAIYGTIFDNTNANPAIQGESHSFVGVGVVGINTDQTSGHFGGVGMQGSTQSPSGFGAIGDARFATGAAVGIEGLAAASGTAGVFNNTGGGTILSGRNNGAEVFNVDGNGVVHAAGYQSLSGTSVSPQQVALFKWYGANQTASFAVGAGPARMTFDGTHIWVINRQAGTITKLRASDGASLGTFTAGINPNAAAFDGANIWIANTSGNNVAELRASDGTLVNTFSAGASPDGIAFDGMNMWVANSSGSNITKLRASDGVILGTFPTGAGPAGVVFDGTNIWVANSSSSTVSKLRASDGAPQGTFNVGLTPLALTFDGANVWAANSNSNNVTKLRASDGVVLGTFPAGTTPAGIAFDGVNIWVTNFNSNNVTKLRASDGAVLGTFSAGSGPLGVAFDGANIWVANVSSNTVSKL